MRRSYKLAKSMYRKQNDNNAETCSKNETLFLISHVSCYTELISSLEFKNVCQWQSVSIVTLMHLQHQQNCFMWNSFYRFNFSLRFFVLFCVLCNKWNTSIFSIFYTFSFQRFQRLHYIRTFNKAGYILKEKSILYGFCRFYESYYYKYSL